MTTGVPYSPLRVLSLLLLLSVPAWPQAVETLDAWRLHSTTTLQADLHHVQGIDIKGNRLWVSSVDARAGKGYLSLLDRRSGKLLAQVEVQQGKRIHPGGLTLDGDSVWIPVAEYDRDGPTNIERRNKQTLAWEASFEVNDHIGCIAAGRDFLIGGSWGSRTIYRWSKDGQQQDRRTNLQPTEYQDLKMDGALLMGSGNRSRTAGSIEWLDPVSLALRRRIATGVTDRKLPFTHEGMTYRRGVLYLLPEDAPSRLFEFHPARP